MAWDWDLFLGKRRMPEGYAAILSQDVTARSDASSGVYSFKLDSDYWFYLEAIMAKWYDVALVAPSIQIYRTLGDRSYMSPPVDFRLIGSPGDTDAGRARLAHVVGLGMYFPPGSALQMQFNYGFWNEAPEVIQVAALGRYVLEAPQDG